MRMLCLILLTGCAQHDLLSLYRDVEQCESQASTATGIYKAGMSQGKTWLEIKNDCLTKRLN